jgi:hypothetical protein
MVKYTITWILREGEDTILASGGEGVFAWAFPLFTEKLLGYCGKARIQSSPAVK